MTSLHPSIHQESLWNHPPFSFFIMAVKVMLAYTCKFLLYICGWNDFNSYSLSCLNNTKDDLVMLIAHTSYWDFIIGVLYLMSEDANFEVRFIVGEHIFERFWFAAPILRALGCMQVPRLQNQTGKNHTVSSIVKQLMTDPYKKKVILIAPNGTTKASKNPNWKTGWYHIARGYTEALQQAQIPRQCKIGTIGINYHPQVRTIHFGLSPVMWVDPMVSTIQESMSILKRSMQCIFPKFPGESSVPIISTSNHQHSADDQALYSVVPTFDTNVPQHTHQLIDYPVFMSSIFRLLNIYFLTNATGRPWAFLFSVYSFLVVVDYHRRFLKTPENMIAYGTHGMRDLGLVMLMLLCISPHWTYTFNVTFGLVLLQLISYVQFHVSGHRDLRPIDHKSWRWLYNYFCDEVNMTVVSLALYQIHNKV